MGRKKARHRRSFSREFKAEVVELVRCSGKTVPEVCRDLDLTETAVRGWVRQAEIDGGEPALLYAQRPSRAQPWRMNDFPNRIRRPTPGESQSCSLGK